MSDKIVVPGEARNAFIEAYRTKPTTRSRGNQTEERLTAAIRAALEVILEPTTVRVVVVPQENPESLGELSPLLYDTVALLIGGYEVAEIAALYQVEPVAINSRVHRAKDKLGVATTIELAVAVATGRVVRTVPPPATDRLLSSVLRVIA